MRILAATVRCPAVVELAKAYGTSRATVSRVLKQAKAGGPKTSPQILLEVLDSMGLESVK